MAEEKQIRRTLEDYAVVALGFIIFGVSLIFGEYLGAMALLGLIVSIPLIAIFLFDLCMTLMGKSIKQLFKRLIDSIFEGVD